MKNKEFIKSNILEAIEELQEIINDIDTDADYSETELKIQLEHAYHHINYAWHIRNESEVEVAECSESNFKKWSKFPVGEIYEYQ